MEDFRKKERKKAQFMDRFHRPDKRTRALVYVLKWNVFSTPFLAVSRVQSLRMRASTSGVNSDGDSPSENEIDAGVGAVDVVDMAEPNGYVRPHCRDRDKWPHPAPTDRAAAEMRG